MRCARERNETNSPPPSFISAARAASLPRCSLGFVPTYHAATKLAPATRAAGDRRGCAMITVAARRA